MEKVSVLIKLIYPCHSILHTYPAQLTTVTYFTEMAGTLESASLEIPYDNISIIPKFQDKESNFVIIIDVI